MSFWKWSQTAGSNATADGSINWAEGQPPSSVNDSARAMMAASAKYRDDISGSIATGGNSTTYTVASSQSFDTLAHMNTAMVAFTPHTTSGASPTLNVDGLGAKPLRSAPSVDLPSGTLIQGTPYVATYYNGTAEWILQGFFGNPYNLPIGGLLPFVSAFAPNSSFVLPYGQAISRTTYSALFALTGTTWGVGDGSTTFNIIDLRGRMPIGKDDMGGSAAGRVTSGGSGINGTAMASAGGAETVTLDTTMIPSHNHALTDPGHTHVLPNVPNSAALAASGADRVSGTTTGTTNSTTTGITLANTGGGLAHNNMPPIIVVAYIMRVI